MKTNIINEIEKNLGYTFSNKSLLEQALTRRSYAKENGGEDNETLEFIGDSVVGVVVVKYVTDYYKQAITPQIREGYRQRFAFEGAEYIERNPFSCELSEEELSELKISLVRRDSLAAATERCGFHKHLIMGNGDVMRNVQDEAAVKEDLFEAIIGAVAIDCAWNMTVLEEIVLRLLEVDKVLEEGFSYEPDYEAELEAWFASRGKTPEFNSCPSDCPNLTHSVWIDLGAEMLSHFASGYGKTERGARRLAAKRAMVFIEETGELARQVREAVGNPDYNRAINQLQELWQKGIIPKPKYEFSEYGKSESGNPMWKCICKVEKIYDSHELEGYICESKNEAKKAAAIEALNYLIGRDVARMFVEQGTEIIDEEETING